MRMASASAWAMARMRAAWARPSASCWMTFCSASARAWVIWVASSSASRCWRTAACFSASALAIDAPLEAICMLSARSWSLIFCAASSWAMRARCSSCACTTSASALARAADSRRRASATSLRTALMLRLLNDSPRSISSREQASLMMTASSSSSLRWAMRQRARRGGDQRRGGRLGADGPVRTLKS